MTPGYVDIIVCVHPPDNLGDRRHFASQAAIRSDAIADGDEVQENCFVWTVYVMVFAFFRMRTVSMLSMNPRHCIGSHGDESITDCQEVCSDD